MTLVQNDDGSFTLDNQGTDEDFTGPGKTDPTRAAPYGVPADLLNDALFFQPQVGYHSVLVQPDPNKQVFEYFSEDHTLYEFQVEPLLAPFGKTSTLRYIQDPNGNRTTLYYSQNDPGYSELPQTLQDAIDDDQTTLDVVTDSTGRA